VRRKASRDSATRDASIISPASPLIEARLNSSAVLSSLSRARIRAQSRKAAARVSRMKYGALRGTRASEKHASATRLPATAAAASNGPEEQYRDVEQRYVHLLPFALEARV